MKRILFISLNILFLFASCPESDFARDQLEKHVRYLSSDELLGRFPGSRGDSLAQVYIKCQFYKSGLLSYHPDSNYSQKFYVGSEGGCDIYSSNIIGYIPGKNSESAIVIGAHFDHIGYSRNHSAGDTIYNGADDNASGVSLILELARVAKSTTDNDCGIYFIAFGAEEKHSTGSRYFLNTWADSLKNIKAMLNFDMVGRMEDNDLSVNHTWSAIEWRDYLSNIPVSHLDIEYDVSRAWTDSRVFLKNDIPALWFYTGHHSDYHRPGDEYQKLNYEGMEKILNYSIQLLAYISRDSVELTSDD